MRRLVLSCVASAIVASPAIASAQQGSVAVAEALFREGKALLEKKDYAHACPKLAESHRQDPATGTLLALALCYEADGKFASAWSAYVDVAARAKREGRADREQAANNHASALEPTLSKLTVNVSADVARLPGLSVTRDDTSVGSALFGTAVPADGGVHVIVATAPGKKRREWKLQLAPKGDAKSVTIDDLEDEETTAEPSPAPSATAAPIAPPPTDDAQPPPAPLARTWQTFGLIVGGLGVAGVITSGAFGFVARKKNNDSMEGCQQNLCDRGGLDNREAARRWGNAATVTFIASAAFVGSGVVLYIVGSESEKKRVTFAPALGGGVLSGAF